jgi:hypothetical protein
MRSAPGSAVTFFHQLSSRLGARDEKASLVAAADCLVTPALAAKTRVPRVRFLEGLRGVVRKAVKLWEQKMRETAAFV